MTLRIMALSIMTLGIMTIIIIKLIMPSMSMTIFSILTLIMKTLSIMTLSIMTLIIMTFIIITLGAITLCIMPPTRMTLRITFNINKLNIMALRIMTQTLWLNNTKWHHIFNFRLGNTGNILVKRPSLELKT
jgi:hypothetical protein